MEESRRITIFNNLRQPSTVIASRFSGEATLSLQGTKQSFSQKICQFKKYNYICNVIVIINF